MQDLISTKKIDCEFVIQPAVRAFYSRGMLNDVELALLKLQETAPEQAKLMTLVTDRTELTNLRVPGATGAIVTSIAARMWPYKLVARILEDLLTSAELNGSFNLQTLTPVQALAQYDLDRWTVKTPRGCIVANKVVLATNAYTSHLLPQFADLIVPVRGQMTSLVPLPSVAGGNRLKNSMGFDGEAIDEYLIQRPSEKGGHLMFGGGRQVGGETVGIADDSIVDESISQYLRSSLIERLALPEGNVVQGVERKCERCAHLKVRQVCALSTHLNSCNLPLIEHSSNALAKQPQTAVTAVSRPASLAHPYHPRLPTSHQSSTQHTNGPA